MLKSVRGSSTGEAVVCGRAANNEAAAEVRMTRPVPAGNAHSNKNINFLADNYTMKKIILFVLMLCLLLIGCSSSKKITEVYSFENKRFIDDMTNEEILDVLKQRLSVENNF